MSTVNIIAAIIILLAGLVCYALIYQTSKQKKQNKERLLIALLKRARNFKTILDALPKGFLPPELMLLLQKSLQEIYTQLTNIDPQNTTHRGNLEAITQQMAQAALNPNQPTTCDPTQFKEIKACLEELYKFIFRLEDRRKIARTQGDAYRGMIQQLIFRLTIDSYLTHAMAAEANSKSRLALHYYQLALNIIKKEGPQSPSIDKLPEIEGKITLLTQALETESQMASNASPESAGELPDEWDSFEEGQSEWKKKQVYD